jgi:bifunctional DNA-binding transcriptional regulator/antitoxin component of YhaV-PrlF toxin-antitoxin module
MFVRQVPMVSDTVVERRPMAEIAAGLPTKSAKIRALDGEGYTRSEIAKFLEIRYQHVRNVLVGPKPKPKPKPEAVPETVWLTVERSGRIAIPTDYREALGVAQGDRVQLRMEGADLHVVSRATAIARAQAMVAKYVPEGVSLVDELIAERRREAAAEDEGE